MKRRPIVAGQRRAQNNQNDRWASTKANTRSRYYLLTGVAIPTTAIIAAFFTTPAYDLWQDWKINQEPPLKAEVQPMGTGNPEGYLFPNELPAEKVEKMHVDRDREATRMGAIPVAPYDYAGGDYYRGENFYQVTLTGNRREKVQIRDIRAHVLSCKPIPKHATLLMWEPEGGSPVSRTAVDLDSSSQRIHREGSDRPFFDESVRYATEGEPLSFEVGASTARGWCSWEIMVDVAYGDQKETITVRRHGSATGKPLETASWPGDAPSHNASIDNLYQVSVVTLETVNCGEARRGIPESVESAKRGNVCGFL